MVCNTLRIDLDEHPIDLSAWEKRRATCPQHHARRSSVGIIGKYVTMPDAYLSVGESIRHAGFAMGATHRNRVARGRARAVRNRRRSPESARRASSCPGGSVSEASKA